MARTESQLFVELIGDSGDSKLHPIASGAEIRFGRNPEQCNLVTDDLAVSRVHLRFLGHTDHVVVEDIGSRMGSFLRDGSRISAPTPLKPGDQVRAGQVTLRIVSVGGKAPSKKAAYINIKRRVHQTLLDRLDLRRGRQLADNEAALRNQVQTTLNEIVHSMEAELREAGARTRDIIKEVLDEAVGLGPLEDALEDPTISEIMVVDRDHIYVEKNGRLSLLETTFTSDDAIRAVIERIVTPLGRRIDEAQPLVDARLKDGSRVNAIIPPLALKGPCITIRKFSEKRLSVKDLVKFDSLSSEMARFLELAVGSHKNVIVSGGTGSGKTTLLNILSSFIGEDERIVTIEDAAELSLDQEHVVSLETRPPNLEGTGAFTIRDLLKNALRMRPDRIVVGECRGGEAIDMLQAMNTGHDGSLTTLHANSPNEAVTRLEAMVLMFSGGELPLESVRAQIGEAVHVIVQQARFSDGSRRVTHISEVLGLNDEGQVQVQDIFRFREKKGSTPTKIRGVYQRTGFIPSFYGELLVKGLVGEGEFL